MTEVGRSFINLPEFYCFSYAPRQGQKSIVMPFDPIIDG